MDFVPWTSFDRIVARYGGDVRVRSLRCGEQFRIMAFAQMTYRESLRDIEACLGAQPSKLYGMGLREAVARSTLADANELRDWRIWADIAAVLVRRARKLYVSDDIGLDLANTVYRAVVRDVDSASAQIKGPVLTAGLFNSLYLKCKRTGESKTLHPGEKWRCQRDVGFQRRKISDSLTGNPNQKSRGCRGIRFVSDPIGRNRGPATGRR